MGGAGVLMTGLDLSIIGFFSVVVIGIGIWQSRQASKSSADFFLGGRGNASHGPEIPLIKLQVHHVRRHDGYEIPETRRHGRLNIQVSAYPQGGLSEEIVFIKRHGLPLLHMRRVICFI